MPRFSLWPDNLLIDYQFTFSLLQEDDRYYTAINFMATPEQVTPAHRHGDRGNEPLLLKLGGKGRGKDELVQVKSVKDRLFGQ